MTRRRWILLLAGFGLALSLGLVAPSAAGPAGTKVNLVISRGPGR